MITNSIYLIEESPDFHLTKEPDSPLMLQYPPPLRSISCLNVICSPAKCCPVSNSGYSVDVRTWNLNP